MKELKMTTNITEVKERQEVQELPGISTEKNTSTEIRLKTIAKKTEAKEIQEKTDIQVIKTDQIKVIKKFKFNIIKNTKLIIIEGLSSYFQSVKLLFRKPFRKVH